MQKSKKEKLEFDLAVCKAALNMAVSNEVKEKLQEDIKELEDKLTKLKAK